MSEATGELGGQQVGRRAALGLPFRHDDSSNWSKVFNPAPAQNNLSGNSGRVPSRDSGAEIEPQLQRPRTWTRVGRHFRSSLRCTWRYRVSK